MLNSAIGSRTLSLFEFSFLFMLEAERLREEAWQLVKAHDRDQQIAELEGRATVNIPEK